jgi:hypothetical protein
MLDFMRNQQDRDSGGAKSGNPNRQCNSDAELGDFPPCVACLHIGYISEVVLGTGALLVPGGCIA